MIVSTTIASVIEFAGNDTAPVTATLVEVSEDIMELPRVVRSETYRLVEVMPVIVAFVAPRLLKKPLVEVTLVPVAVVKPNAPDNVPPVKSR